MKISREKSLRQSVYDVNDAQAKNTKNIDRMQVRFNRTLIFLDYLAEKEEKEFEMLGSARARTPLCDRFMPAIINRFHF